MKLTVTHKGWFGLCPVYLGDLHTDAPVIEPRWWIAKPLMALSHGIFAIMFFVQRLLGRECSGWPLVITDRLHAPLELEADDA